MKRPWRKRAPIKSQRSFVTAQTKPPKAIKRPPVRMMGWIGSLSARKPKGRLDKAIPRMTAETLKETSTKSAENSCRSTGNMG
jgi:hypothetical protein